MVNYTLPKSSIICEYCDVRNDIEVKAKDLGLFYPKSKRSCPECLVYLDSIDIGKNSKFIIEKCPKCYGLFFDTNELKALLDEIKINSLWINNQKLHSLLQHPLHTDVVKYRKCPVCKNTMHRKNFMRRSGVIIDVCIDHGAWLDAGELKQLQDWTKLGGQKKTEKLENNKKQTKIRDTNKKQSATEQKQDTEVITDILDNISSLFHFGSGFGF